MEINYDKLKKEVINFLNKNNNLVLATSADNRVSARLMSCVNRGLNIIFQTDIRSHKCRQIEKNSHVALCAGYAQIEGVATIGKHPMDESNKEFIELFKKRYLKEHEIYSHLKHRVVISVEPNLITLWKYRNGKAWRDILLIEASRAKREYYDVNNYQNKE